MNIFSTLSLLLSTGYIAIWLIGTRFVNGLTMNELNKVNKETIMLKAKLNLITLVLLFSVTSIMAEPYLTTYTANPEPVHGMEFLESQTIYPTMERDLQNDGYVVLSFHIDVLGNVSNISVTQSGGSDFDESAIAAVKNTDWNPAMQNGIAIPVTYEQPFHYSVK